MRTFFLSDIHGNLPALEIALKHISPDDYIIFLGDIVNYGPWSNECIELIQNINNKICLIGNHETYFLNGSYPEKGIVNDFFKICFYNFKYFDVIKSFKSKFLFEDYNCQHTINNNYIFKDTTINIDTNYIIGHSHQQFIKNINQFKLINPGSIGQNRFNLNIISFCFYDHEKNNFEFLNLEYNSNVIINEMKLLNYPINCIDYYEKKNLK